MATDAVMDIDTTRQTLSDVLASPTLRTAFVRLLKADKPLRRELVAALYEAEKPPPRLRDWVATMDDVEG